ncbi:hypothetical protein D3C76_1082500 [compost metagenome]
MHVLDGLFTCQLALAVYPERIGCVVLVVGGGFQPVENIVRGVMYQRNVQSQRLFGENAGSDCVDGEGGLRLALCQVNRGMGRRVDDQVGPDVLHLAANLIGLREIELIATQYDQFADSTQPPLQLMRDLAVAAIDEYFHGCSPVSSRGKSGSRRFIAHPLPVWPGTGHNPSCQSTGRAPAAVRGRSSHFHRLFLRDRRL